MSVSPLAQGSLDKAFGFAVGARRIGASATMFDAMQLHQATKGARLVTGSIVGEQGTNGNAETGVIGQRGSQKGGRGIAFLIRQDLRKGDAGMVIDGDVNVLPSDALDVLTAVAMDAVSDTANTTEFLDIEMEQITGMRMLVADQRGNGFQITVTVAVQATENAADGSGAEPEIAGDALAGPALAAEGFDLAEEFGRSGTAQTMRSRAAVAQAAGSRALVTPYPFTGGLEADFELGCSRVQSQTLKENRLGQLLSTMQGKSGILVDVHSLTPK